MKKIFRKNEKRHYSVQMILKLAVKTKQPRVHSWLPWINNNIFQIACFKTILILNEWLHTQIPHLLLFAVFQQWRNWHLYSDEELSWIVWWFQHFGLLRVGSFIYQWRMQYILSELRDSVKCRHDIWSLQLQQFFFYHFMVRMWLCQSLVVEGKWVNHLKVPSDICYKKILKCNSTFKIKKRYVVELNLTFHRTPWLQLYSEHKLR